MKDTLLSGVQLFDHFSSVSTYWFRMIAVKERHVISFDEISKKFFTTYHRSATIAIIANFSMDSS